MVTWRWEADWETQLLALPGVVKALDKAGEIVEAGAKRRAPVSHDGSHGRPPGHLKASIDRQAGRDTTGPYVDVRSPATTPAGEPYGLFCEVGTRPHLIVSHGPWPLRDRHGRVFGRVVHHPGTPAQPYLRPALFDLAGQTFR